MASADGIELIMIIIGSLGQALAANGDSVGTMNIYAVLIVWRFVVSIM